MKKLITTLGMLVSANAFAYTATIANQSNLDLVVKTNGTTVCTVAAMNKVDCNNLDAYTNYEINYKLNATAEQRLASMKKDSYQVLQATASTSSSALANYKVQYTAYIGSTANYSGSFDNFLNSQNQVVAGGFCRADGGAGITCQLSSYDNLTKVDIVAVSDFKPAPAPAPTPTPVKTTSGMYIADYGNWVSGTLYTTFWSNDVNAQVYPEVTDNGQTYVACYGIDSSIKDQSPSQVYQKQNWGPWIPFNNGQAQNVCDAPALKSRAVAGTAMKFW
ncbi:hypothetical protein [Aquella oligotrophica]|uniref:Uncharacterized protein n=1 Tax=Aquella oligotrophica TaxID=2067065 RepID=A0A2I7N7V1_9NEIS|nr:hypothetical protein [Aquella oligotrophica]AUR52533.1 hypothetical protein CUN60_09560 [Aquella oligotrophica]